MKTVFRLSHIILSIFFLLFYAPIIKMIIESFFINNTFDLGGYKEILFDSEVILSFLTSCILAILNAIITIFISLQTIKHFFFYKNNNLFIILTYLNIILPEMIVGIAMLLFFTWMHIPLGFFSLLICHINFSLSYAIPLLYQRWNEFDKKYILTAHDLGANKKYIWKTIIIPYLKPTIVVVAFLCFILSFDDYIFSYFCSSTGTNLFINTILELLRLGLSPKIKSLFTIQFLFSTLICLVYLLFNGTKNEKKIN